MKKLILIATIVLMLTFAGCTQQERAKQYGGTTTMTLPQGQKLVVVTWKEDDLWYLTRPMKQEEVAETYTFRVGRYSYYQRG